MKLINRFKKDKNFMEAKKMLDSLIQITMLIVLIVFISSPFIAQCTDADGDGYFYEDGCGTPRDCNDANAEIRSGANEQCNGYDDNCNGVLDEFCSTSCDDPEKIGLDIRITYDSSYSYDSCLVWTGKEFGIAWVDYPIGTNGLEDSEIYFSRIDSVGNKIGSNTRVTFAPDFSVVPSVVWTGSEYGLAWTDLRDGIQVYFARLDDSGNKIGSDIRVTFNYPNASGRASLVWTGHEYGLSWIDDRDGNHEIYFARLDSEGKKIGSDVRVTYDSSISSFPAIIWTGSEYGIAWSDDRDNPSSPYNFEIYFARLDPSGNKMGDDVRVTYVAADAKFASLVWTGNEYGISWNDNRYNNEYPLNYEIFFARLDAYGNKIGSDIRITESPEFEPAPLLVWTGSEYGLSWFDLRHANSEIYFARLGASGQKIGSDLRITYDNNSSWGPSLAWTGSQYAVAWHDNRDWNPEIYFARIGCPIEACIDFDPDTLNLKSKGKWMTCYIELPEEYPASYIDLSTVTLSVNASDPIHAEVSLISIGDYDKDEIPDLMIKFDRSLIQSVAPIGDSVPFEVTGKLYAKDKFSGVDYIKVIGAM